MKEVDIVRRGEDADEQSGVVVLAGPPCSGKSQVGQVLARDWSRTSRHYIEVDSIFELLLPGSDRSMSDRMIAYDAAHALAGTLLDRGRFPILECTYSRRGQRASLGELLAHVRPAPLWVVEFSVSPDVAVNRFRRSATHQATDLTEQLVSERARTFPYSEGALQLASTTNSPEDLARQVTHWLSGRPPPIETSHWVGAGKP